MFILGLSSFAFIHQYNYEDRAEVPDWDNPKGFEEDVFMFARVKYTSHGFRERWQTDYPDSDLNFSYRLQQMTTIKVNPNPVIVELTEDDLSNYPFLYMLEVGSISLTTEEEKGIKKYLDNGGFIMVDDFWGDDAWAQMEAQMKYIYPNREFVELDIDHPIFHIVYDFDEKPQVPAIGIALDGRPYGITWERGEEGRQVHFKALYDEDGRMVMLSLLGGVNVENVNLLNILRKRLSIMGSTLRARSLEYKIQLTKDFCDYAIPKFQSKDLKPIVDSIYSWENVADAHRYMEANKNKGKIILKISD